MNKRLANINHLLTEYARGRFGDRLPISERLDEIDAISAGINMLAEELQAITISRNYFNSIFNAVSDMVFVVARNGQILETNLAARCCLHPAGLLSRSFATCLGKPATWFRSIRSRLSAVPVVSIDHLDLDLPGGGRLPVCISATTFTNEKGEQLLLFTATDTSYRVQAENLILRAIIDTQEKERRRWAQDLHDSVTQQLSGIKFALSSLLTGAPARRQQSILQQCNSGLGRLIAELRSICFNLMPKTLEEFGLVRAIREFHAQALFDPALGLVLSEFGPLPPLDTELSIDLYRIVQEFMSNAVRHGRASQVTILLEPRPRRLDIRLKDNGSGFDPAVSAEGMGLQNVRCRLRSHQGTLQVSTAPGKGVQFMIRIPLKQEP